MVVSAVRPQDLYDTEACGDEGEWEQEEGEMDDWGLSGSSLSSGSGSGSESSGRQRRPRTK